MKEVVLNHIHVGLGAKMVPFAGFSMPVSYKGLNIEHLAVRGSAGIFDVSHMGEFFVTGPNALDLIQFVTSNDASKLVDGQVQYSCLPNENGGAVDDLLVYRYHAEKFLLVVNASNIEKDWNHISKYNERFGATLSNQSDEYCLFAVQGPKAAAFLQTLTEVNLSDIPYYNFRVGAMAGIEEVIISNTGYTGAGGFELYVKNADAEKLWNAVCEAGKSVNMEYAGLGCRDTLRLEKAFCLYGHELNDTTSPIEAGLGWITKFTKDFVGRSIIEGHKTNGVSRKLVGFEMIDRGIPRQGYKIMDAAGNEIGEVTSGTQSPSLGKAIGLGYVTVENSSLGTEIFIEIRDKKIKASVIKTPFL
ncbi:MAG: glycine cleavage system aminomethyltransferase GcvT [Flavobacteriales bacterium]|nr:glycine cleavage system aminomethyltransferase GcvT [Flavobacteriales bacterium]